MHKRRAGGAGFSTRTRHLTQRARFLAVAFISFLALSACGSRVEGPRRAAAELDGATAAGVTYLEFGSKLQALGGAIVLARQEGATEGELRPYVESFETYKDSAALWKMKIDCPPAFSGGDPTSCGPIHIIEGDVETLAAKYKVPYDNQAIKKWRNEGFKGLYPSYEAQRANRDVFDRLLQTMWRKAAQKNS